MVDVVEKEEQQITPFLNLQNEKTLLRFITCGSVDDGKSTLIGRLLFETEMIFDNELTTLQKDSQKFGTTDNDIDFALLVDGLSSEREQGITIDVAYRFFNTNLRKFIVADTPGHEQYTRNMATGASTADLAVVLVDASKGVLTQTKRHSFIVSLLGVKHVVLAINKIDLVNYDETAFNQIKADYLDFAKKLDFDKIEIVPLSALKGDNICHQSAHTPWYTGPSLLTILENAETNQNHQSTDFRFPVQWVNRPNSSFRGFAGTVAKGQIKPGHAITIHPSGKKTNIKRIVSYDGDLQVATQGQSITLTLEDEVDVSRGDVITNADSPCQIAAQFQSTILWMSEKPMMRGRQYILKCASQTALCTPNAPKYKIDVNTMEQHPANNLALNEIGVCDIMLNKDITYESYQSNKTLGSYILIDRMTNETVACGWFNFALRRATNIHQQALSVSKEARSLIKPHKPCVLWFTGLSGAGKSTIANAVEQHLNKQQIHTILLDGDNVRHGLNKDLGFTEKDRAENIRRIAEVARLMCDAGLICLVSFISPFAAERLMAKELIGDEQFVEIYVDTPLDVAEQRDVKGLYQKARRGEIKNFTGIDSPYEIPENPSISLQTCQSSVDDAAKTVIHWLKEKDVI